MAIAEVGTPTAGGTGNGNFTSLTAAVPTAVQGLTDANTLILFTVVGVAASIADIPTPTGWSVWQANVTSSTNYKCATFYRFASAEPAAYTLTGLTSGRWAYSMRARSGVDAATPKDVAPTTALSTTAMVAPPAITPVTAGAVIDSTNTVATATNVITTAWTSSNMTKDTDGTSVNTGNSNAAIGPGYAAWTSGAFTPNMTQATSSAQRGVAITSAIRPAAGGIPATFTTTVGDVAADGGTGAFTGAGTIASTGGDAPADGGATTMTGAGVFASTAGDAAADGGVGAFTGAALFVGTTGDAPADGGAGALVGSAAAVFVTTVGDAAADGGTGSLTGAAAFLTAVGDAVGDGALGVFAGAASFVTGPGDAAAAGGVGSLAAGTVFATTVGDAVADGGPGGFTGAALFVAQAGDVSADGGAAVFTAAAVFLTLPGDAAAAGGPASFVVIIATATPSTRRERVPADPRTNVVPGERRRRTAGTESRTLSA